MKHIAKNRPRRLTSALVSLASSMRRTIAGRTIRPAGHRHSRTGPVVFEPPSTDTYSQYSSTLFADRQVSMYYRNITAVVGSGDVAKIPEAAVAGFDVA